MGELRSDIEEYMENPGQEGSDQKKIEKYSSDAKEIIHKSPEWQEVEDQLEKNNDKHVSQQELDEIIEAGFGNVSEWILKISKLKKDIDESDYKLDWGKFANEDERNVYREHIKNLKVEYNNNFYGELEKFGITQETLVSDPESSYVYFLMCKLFIQGVPETQNFLENKGINILEIAGLVGVNKEWPSLSGLSSTGANYLGTDYKYIPGKNSSLISPGKVDLMTADAFKLNETLGDRQFEVLYCLSFLGAPSTLAARSRNIDGEKYDTEILTQFDNQLRNGGVLILGNREKPSINVSEKLEKLGYEVIDFKTSVINYVIAKKTSN